MEPRSTEQGKEEGELRAGRVGIRVLTDVKWCVQLFQRRPHAQNRGEASVRERSRGDRSISREWPQYRAPREVRRGVYPHVYYC